MNYYSKAGYKPVYGLEHNERNFKVTYENGWYEDDDEWVEKQNNIRFDYKNHHIAPGLPLSYSAYFERGLWKNDDTGRKSWHTEYGAFLNHDRIYLFNSKKTSLDLTIGKKWTRESADDSVESTNVYYATLAQKISRIGIPGLVIIVKILRQMYLPTISLIWLKSCVMVCNTS